MVTPPEVVFDRFLRTELSLADRQLYTGKLDLDAISYPPGMREMLIGFQTSFHQALLDRPEQAEYVSHPPVHFDYIESTIPNALAFHTEHFSFVGVTLPLILELLQTCILLSRSDYVGTLLAGIPGPDKQRRIIELCHGIQLSFVFAHEYTHIVHGHTLPATPESMFADEIETDSSGNIDVQAREVDADGYAAFLVMNDLMNGPGRSLMAERIGLQTRPFAFKQPSTELEDLTFFAAFVLAIGGYFYLRLPAVLDEVGIYRLTHPPPPVRMNYVMRIATSVAKHNREHIASKMTPDRYTMFMRVIAKALHGESGIGNWDAQNAFLLSGPGMKYLGTLERRYQSMPPRG